MERKGHRSSPKGNSLSKGGRLVIEVDGEEAHKNSRQSDQSRDAFLRAQGCNVFRTSARAVLETPYAVIQEIKEKLTQ